MERIVKVRVIVPFKDMKQNGEYQDTQKVLYLSCERAMELYKKGLLALMEIRRSDNGR